MNLKNKSAVILYFTTSSCSVCKVLKPAVLNLITENFPEIEFIEINTEKNPKTAAEYDAFSVPLILVFFEGKEFFRTGRFTSISELKESIERPYRMVFEDKSI